MKKTLIGFVAAAGATLALFAAPAAHARTDVHLNIGLGTPYVYSQPSYVYSQPSYVYTQPSYVYTQPYYGSISYGHNHGYHQPRYYRDRDGDGVPNRFDRRPNNPYRY